MKGLIKKVSPLIIALNLFSEGSLPQTKSQDCNCPVVMFFHPRGHVEVDRNGNPFLYWYPNGYSSSLPQNEINNPDRFPNEILRRLPTAPFPNLIQQEVFLYENGIVEDDKNGNKIINHPEGAILTAPARSYLPIEIIGAKVFRDQFGRVNVIRYVEPPLDPRNPKFYQTNPKKSINIVDLENSK